MGRKSKAKAGNIPKRIGGVKLPKELRKGLGKAGGTLARAAGSPAGQDLIATGLAIAAAAIRAQATRQRTASRPAAKPPVPTAASAPPRAANTADPHEIGAELGRIAEAALQGLFGGRRKV